jgi:hypothetical protein
MISGIILATVSDYLNILAQQHSQRLHGASIPFADKPVIWFDDLVHVPAVTHARDDLEEAQRQFVDHPIF